MLNFTDREIRDIIKEYVILHDEFMLEPVGNHEVKRHLVYKVTPIGAEPVIFKMYYKTNRRCREMASLRLLAGRDFRCPEIVGHGILPTGEEWLVMNCLTGGHWRKCRRKFGLTTY